MAITTLEGLVTGFRVDTTTTTNITMNPAFGSGVPTTGTATGTTTASKMHFRIANRPAYMNVAANLTNGDVITAAGIQHPGEFEVFALKNHTTSTLYWITSLPLWICGLIIAFGLITLSILIGWLILPVGIFYWIREGNKKKNADEGLRLVQAAPAPAIAAAATIPGPV